MRRSYALPVVLSMLLGSVAAAPAQTAQGASAPQNEKSEAAPRPSPTQPPAPTTDQQKQGENAVQSTSGRAGKEEPTSHAPTKEPRAPEPVLVNGALNVPGAPTDSQTVPSKFSERNAKLDKLPIVGFRSQ